MRFLSFLFVSLAGALPDIEVRDNVLSAGAALISLKASAFCSSFVPIKDVTSTSTITGPASTVTISTCTSTGVTTTTSTKSMTVSPTATSTSTSTTATSSKTPTTVAMCEIGTSELSGFACDVLSKACVSFVKPNTVIATTTALGSTVTVVSATPCPVAKCKYGNAAGSACNPRQKYHNPASGVSCQQDCNNQSNYGQGCVNTTTNASGTCYLNIICCLADD